jgi:hypothetical protein
MSTLNFPTSPSLNDTYTFGTKTWVWNGAAWQLQSSGAINDIPVGNVTPSTGAFTTLSATGNITGNYFIGNGSQLTGIDATSIQNGTSNVRVIAPDGNVTVGIGGTSNVLIVSSAGVEIAGNITGNNITGTLLTNAQPNITSVGTLTSVSVTGNVTGGNLITAGLVSLSSVTKTGTSGVGNIGESGSTFNTVFAKATSAQYADVAERYQADADYPVGTVLVLGGSHEVTASTTSHDTAVAGVVSENPSYLMNAALQTANAVPVALLGRVLCQVVGVIRRGDLLVTSSIPGTATALDRSQYLPGCVIGKALADYNSSGPGMIEIAVGVK